MKNRHYYNAENASARRILFSAIVRQYFLAIWPELHVNGVVLSFIVVCILLFAGWKGWEMVYRHRVGVTDEVVTGHASTTTAQRRAA